MGDLAGNDIAKLIVEHALGYAIDHGISFIRDRGRRDPVKANFETALTTAFDIFQREFPEWSSALFDEHFLMHSATSLFARYLDSAQTVDPEELADLWVKQLGSGISQDRLEKGAQAAKEFLTILENELRRFPATFGHLFFNPALESLQRIERNTSESASLQRNQSAQVGEILREIAADRTVDLHTTLPLTNAPPELHGPPFDEALLPTSHHFIDRHKDLDWLLARLRGVGSGDAVAVRGLPGVGKTALVAHTIVIARAEGLFSDGIAVVFCRKQTNPTALVRQILGRFDPHRREPAASEPAELLDAARRLLGGKSVLIVLDNVDPDLPLAMVTQPLVAAGARLLITARQFLSRDALTSDAAHLLKLLSENDAIDLFMSELGHVDDHEPVALSAKLVDIDRRPEAAQIVRLLGHHTLAVKIAARYAADLARDLRTVARELEDPQRAISLPDGETQDAVARAFAQSTDALPESTRLLFEGLAAFASFDMGRVAVLALAAELGLDEPAWHLDQLVRRALVDQTLDTTLPVESDRERIHLQQLLRAFAARGFESWQEDRRESTRAAIARHYGAYLNTAPTDDAIAADEANIEGGLDWAHVHEDVFLEVQYCLRLHRYWWARGRSGQALRYLPKAIAVVRATYQETGLPEVLRALGTIAHTYGIFLDQAGNLDTAGVVLEAVLRIQQGLGNVSGQILALSSLGAAALERGRVDTAEIYFRTGLQEAQAHGLRDEEGVLLLALAGVALERGDLVAAETNLRDFEEFAQDIEAAKSLDPSRFAVSGQIAMLRGNLDVATEQLSRAVAAARLAQDPRPLTTSLVNLGDIAQIRGKLDDAERYFEEARMLNREMQSPRGEAAILLSLGNVARTRGDEQRARKYAHQALTLALYIGVPSLQGTALFQLGELARLTGDWKRSEEYLRGAQTIMVETKDRLNEAAVLTALGQVAFARGGRDTEAEELLKRSLALHREVGNRSSEGIVLANLGELSERRGHLNLAEGNFRQALAILREVGGVDNLMYHELRFGTFLVERRSKRREGCALVNEAVETRRTLHLPGVEEALAVARRLGCIK